MCITADPRGRAVWSMGLRPLVRLPGLWVRIPPGHQCLSLVSVVCCQRSVRRGQTECGVSVCGRKASIMERPWPTRGSCALWMCIRWQINNSFSMGLLQTQITQIFLSSLSIFHKRWKLKNKRPTWCHAILFHLLCAQHVSDINILITRSMRLFCWITTLVVLFLVRCVLEFLCGWVGVVSVLQVEACNTITPKLQHTSNQEQYDQCGNSTE